MTPTEIADTFPPKFRTPAGQNVANYIQSVRDRTCFTCPVSTSRLMLNFLDLARAIELVSEQMDAQAAGQYRKNDTRGGS